MNKNIVLVFTRNPELGKVKTRLAASVGNEKALEIYQLLLERTKEVTNKLDCDKAVYYSVKIRTNDLWNSDIYQKKLQEGETLGIRMRNAFQNAFENGYEKVVLIGSDLYDLTSTHIEQAFQKLSSNDFVIGPAEDGGYYLLGMKTLQPKIFDNKKWGSSSVLNDTFADIEKLNVHLLETLNDIDTFDDLQKNKFLMKRIN